MTATLAEATSTDDGLSEIDAMIRRGTSEGQAGPFHFFSKNKNVGMPPKEILVAKDRLSQKLKYYRY